MYWNIWVLTSLSPYNPNKLPGFSSTLECIFCGGESLSHTFQGENCISSLHTSYRHGEVLHLLPADHSVPVQVVEFEGPFEFLLIRAMDEESQAENKILVSVSGWKLVERRGKFDLKYLKSNYFSVLLGDGGEHVVRV